MKANFENMGNTTYLTYEVEEGQQLDSMTLGMLSNNTIPGLAEASFMQLDTKKYIKYNVSSKVSVAQLFAGPVNKKRLISVFSGIVDAMLSAEEYMLDTRSILLDKDYIFADVTTIETVMICLPMLEVQNQEPLSVFFKNILFTTQFDQTENCDHVAQLLNFLNSTPALDLMALKHLLETIGKDGKPAAAAPVQAAPQVAPQTAPQAAPKAAFGAEPPKAAFGVQPVAQQTAPAAQPVAPAAPQQPAAPAPQPPKAPETGKSGFSLFGFKSNKADKKETKQAPKAGVEIPGAAAAKAPEKSAGFAVPGKSSSGGFAVPGKSSSGGFAVPGKSAGFAVPGKSAAPAAPAPAPAAPAKAPKASKAAAGGDKCSKCGAAMKPEQKFCTTCGAKRDATATAAPVAPAPAAPQSVAPQSVAPQSVAPAPAVPQSVAPQNLGGNLNFGETTVLGGSVGETTVLGAGAETSKPQPHLIRIKNNEKIPLNKPVFRIGKERSYVDYFISDNTAISRSHANIINHNGEYFVVDTNSTNHTYVNGGMIQSGVETKLTHGTKVRFANEDFEFKMY